MILPVFAADFGHFRRICGIFCQFLPILPNHLLIFRYTFVTLSNPRSAVYSECEHFFSESPCFLKAKLSSYSYLFGVLTCILSLLSLFSRYSSSSQPHPALLAPGAFGVLADHSFLFLVTQFAEPALHPAPSTDRRSPRPDVPPRLAPRSPDMRAAVGLAGPAGSL